MFKNFVCLEFMLLFVVACNGDKTMLEQSLNKAGKNKGELEYVLDYYSDCPEKYEAAKFLIANMYEHYSYADGKINQYYHQAFDIITSSLTIDEQIDSLASISKNRIGKLKRVTDVKKITAQYLIYSIEHAFRLWKNQPWAMHLTFEEFCEWLLPYKVVETQSIDKWSEKLYNLLWDNIRNMPPDDDEYNTATKTALMVRQTLREKLQYNINLYGQNNLTTIEEMLYVKSATTSYYSQLLVAACRSVGVPAVLDESALKGLCPTTMFYDTTYKTANQWAVILTSQGLEMPIANDISAEESYAFFPYDKCPKVYRNTFAVNQRVKHYMQTAKYHYPFGLCKHDVTDKYFLTTDLSIPIVFELLKMLKDSYVYIAAEVYMGNQEQKDWLIVDFGKIKDDCALFCKMGRDINYLIMGYNGTELIPISKPFQLCKNGSIKWLDDDVVEN